jgi:carbamate kinase
MRVVVALGGNALLRRGQSPTAETQRANLRQAGHAMAEIARAHDLVVTHGSGPQVGLLALQAAAYKGLEAYPLDVLDAEIEGMIGYMIEQELVSALPEREVATLLTQIEVARDDPAFRAPSKPIGPVYTKQEAERLAAARGWAIAPDGSGYRRVVPSPQPVRILEIAVIELLVHQGVIVICAGGGGIPVVLREDGSLLGVEAVIDKDRASALLARELEADAFLMLTDVTAVWDRWGDPEARAIHHAAPAALRAMTFDPGSMGPKVEAACDFAEATGGVAGIGALADAAAILRGEAGTTIAIGAKGTSFHSAEAAGEPGPSGRRRQ